MPQTHTDLLRELSGISEIFAQLSDTLSEVASDLRASGIPPSPQVLLEMADSRTTFEDLRTRALELASLLSTPASQHSEDIVSLKDIKVLLQSLTEAHEKKLENERTRQQALSMLDRILSLTHRDDAGFQPLLECQAKARDLRKAITHASWPDVHPETTVLAHRRHPFAELLTLVEEYDELDDDLWLVLKHAVAESFGKKLSLAAARGRFILSTAPVVMEPAALESAAPDKEPVTHATGPRPASNGRRQAGSGDGIR